MALPAFPLATFNPGGTTGYAYTGRSQNGMMVAPYGTNASNALSGIGGTVSVGGSISGSSVLAIAQAAVDERVRRGGGVVTIPNGYYTGRVSASRLAEIRTTVEIAGPAASQAYMGGWNNYNSADGQYVTGSGVTPVYDSYYGQTYYVPYTTYAPNPDPNIVTYPQVGTNTGNYNYNNLYATGSRIRSVHINDLITLINNNRAQCTCNCNYCTCNCNYCTCNCNYACTCNCNY